MRNGEAIKVIEAQIKEIKADSRFKAPTTLVQVNAPLALIQVEMKARVAAYEFAVQVMKKVKSI